MARSGSAGLRLSSRFLLLSRPCGCLRVGLSKSLGERVRLAEVSFKWETAERGSSITVVVTLTAAAVPLNHLN